MGRDTVRDVEVLRAESVNRLLLTTVASREVTTTIKLQVKWADFAPLATEGTVTVRKDVEDEEGEEEEGKGEGERREEGRAEEGKKKEQSKYTYTVRD